MKNVLRNYLLIIAVFFTIVTTAMDDEIDVKIGINAKTINFTLQNSDGDIEVSIKDNSGFVLYKEKFQGSLFTKKFDFSTLPKGDYFLEIEGQTRIKIVPFSVAFNFIKMNPKSIYYKPIVRMSNDEIIMISKIAFNEEFLEINLVDQNLNLLYSENLNGSINLNRRLNISGLANGDYTLVMKSENRTFEQILKKKN